VIHSISIAELVAQGVELSTAEVIAICRQLGAGARTPRPSGRSSPEDVVIAVDGSVWWRGRHAAPEAAELALLMKALLPSGAQVPGGLRYLIARALREVDAPAFGSPAEFSGALARYERGDAAVLVAALAAKARPTASIEHRMAPRTRPPADRRRSGPGSDELRRQLREADRDRFEQRLIPHGPPPAKKRRLAAKGPLAACFVAGVTLVGAGELWQSRPALHGSSSTLSTSSLAATDPLPARPLTGFDFPVRRVPMVYRGDRSKTTVTAKHAPAKAHRVGFPASSRLAASRARREPHKGPRVLARIRFEWKR
jgi:hypothetical protein